MSRSFAMITCKQVLFIYVFFFNIYFFFFPQRSEIKQEDGEVFREHFDFPGHRKSKIIITNRYVHPEKGDH